MPPKPKPDKLFCAGGPALVRAGNQSREVNYAMVDPLQVQVPCREEVNSTRYGRLTLLSPSDYNATAQAFPSSPRSNSAGIRKPATRARIILRLRPRLPESTSDTLLRLPNKGTKSLGAS